MTSGTTCEIYDLMCRASFAKKKAMEDVATANLLKRYGKERGKRYTTLHRYFLINPMKKYDKLLGRMFYDYNERK